MRKSQGSIPILVLTGLLPSGCQQASQRQPAETGFSDGIYRVEEVIDGDTFTINGGEKVRLIGLDAPETPESYKQRNFHYGVEAKAYLKELIGEGSVRLEFGIEQRDQYGRLLAYAWLGDDLFINAHLIEKGYARVVTWPPNVKYHDELNHLERLAQENKRGLWKK